MAILYQPIIDLTRHKLAFLEALVRFPDTSLTPDVWFSNADSVGLGMQLELVALEAALKVVCLLPEEVALTVNVGPKAIQSARLRPLLEEAGPRRVVIELTEPLCGDNCDLLKAQYAHLRAMGARFSVDDTAAHDAQLANLLGMAPDFVKVDLKATRAIDFNARRSCLASTVASLMGASETRIVAEGIETDYELKMVEELGFQYGQGYRLGRPAPFELARHHSSTRV
jgi:EAL domain-containing protein (putative c-di-GMP-specific phosphodiesterase class I)